MHVLSVVVVPCVDAHAADAEELPKLVEDVSATRALYNHEVVRHLIAGSVASSVLPVRLTDEADGEAAFSVYKTNNPSGIDRAFLLIVWLPFGTAAKFVTAHPYEIGEYLRMRQVFQQMVGFL
jgi:hypothetical protein